MVVNMNEEAFKKAKEKIINKDKVQNGIGTLSEKTLHAVIKNYINSNESEHEIKIDNFVADIFSNGVIYEVQNGNFNKIRKKLEKFLEVYPVTICYPIPDEKYLVWIDEKTGEMTKKRKSPKRCSEYYMFLELYKIKEFLKHENLNIRIIMVDIEEYRLLNGWSKDRKKGSVRYDRIPIAIKDDILYSENKDFMQLIPIELEEFTVKDFAKQVKIPCKLAGVTLNILSYLEVIDKVGKRGREYLYRIKEY